MKRIEFGFQNWWGGGSGCFDLFSLKFSSDEKIFLFVSLTLFDLFFSATIYRKKEKVSTREEIRPDIDFQANTPQEKDVLSEEVWFEFGFDKEGHISHVWGGKDSTDAFYAKSEYEERAARDKVTPHEFAKLTNIWYDFNTKKCRFLCSRAFLDEKQGKQP